MGRYVWPGTNDRFGRLTALGTYPRAWILTPWFNPSPFSVLTTQPHHLPNTYHTLVLLYPSATWDRMNLCQYIFSGGKDLFIGEQVPLLFQTIFQMDN